EWGILLDLRRRRELVDLLEVSGRSKAWARLGLAVLRMGRSAREAVRAGSIKGAGGALETPGGRVRAKIVPALRNVGRFEIALEKERGRLANVLRKAGVKDAELARTRFDPFRGGAADAIRSVKAEDIDLTLDWLEPFFRLGWRESVLSVD